jgi:hypothetical protein
MTLPLRITDHAVRRYRQRVDPTASDSAVRDCLLAGVVKQAPPMGVQLHRHDSEAVGWVWAGPAVFPVVERDGCLVAVTCIARRPRRCKADVRAWREQQRDGWAAA